MSIDLSAHQLVEVVRGDGSRGCTRHYRMKKPGTRIHCVELLQASGYLIIAGDYVPVHNGSVSAFGYGLGWFAGASSPRYLAEKFLKERWIPSEAAKGIRYWIERGEYRDHHKELSRLASYLDAQQLSAGELLEELEDLDIFDESDIGWGFCPSEVERLTTIQKRWTELWNEHRLGSLETTSSEAVA